MKYMLMICDDESVILSPAEVHALPACAPPASRSCPPTEACDSCTGQADR